MRIGYLADPNSIHTRRWIEWFVRAGHEVHLLDPFGTTIAPGLPDDVTIHPVELTPGPPVIGLAGRRRALRQAMEHVGIDILHAHFVRRFGWQAALSGFHPLVVTPWGSDLLRVRARSLRTRFWNWFALRSADLVTVSSEGMRAAARGAGARPDRIQLVHHGVDTTRFAPGPIRTPGVPRILSIRALAPLYRHETVIDAVAELERAGRPAELVMARLGSDSAYRTDLTQRAASAGIGARLTWLDPVPHDELPDLYRSADVIVSVPETDSFPVTLLEAMACGIPAVVSDIPAVTPVYREIDPVAPDLIVPVGDARATAAALRRAIDLPAADRARLGERLRAFVVATADYDTHMARMEALYRALVRR